MEANARIQSVLATIRQHLPPRGGIAACLLALGLSGLALVVRLAIAPVDAGLQYVTFFPAVTLAVVLGGFGPGLLATLAGIIFATTLFTPPFDTFSMLNLKASFWSNLVFLLDGVIVCASIEAMHRYHLQYEEKLTEAGRLSQQMDAALAEIKVHEAFCHSVFDSRTEQVAVLDENGVIIGVNAAWRRFAIDNGMPDLLHDAVGLNYLQICGEAAGYPNGSEASLVATGIQAVLNGEQLDFSLEYPCHSPNEERWFNLRVTPLQGAQHGVVVAHEDISQRKAMEKLMAHHTAIVESSEDAIVAKTLDGLITSWNKGAERVFGYRREEAIGQPISMIIPESHRSDAWEIQDKVRQGIALRHYQTRRRRKDGTLIDISVTVSPLYDGAGKIIGASKVARDISEQKLAEHEMRIAATAFEANEGMMITDANSIILRVNRAFTLSSGYTAEDAVGQHVRLLHSGRQPPEFYSAMWQTIRREGAWQGEVWNRRKNGEVYPEWLTVTAVKNPAGEVTNYVGTHTDITTRKAAEDEIKHLAFYDPLTRLPNRRLLMDRLQQAVVSASRSEQQGALVFIDLDKFKTLNDTLGHDKGDLLLQQVALRLLACVREGDTVSRLGGDEFVIILKNLSQSIEEAAAQVEGVGEKILVALSEVYTLGEHEYHCTSSIGVTLFGHRHETLADLMMRADFAMYQAKAGGRNALRFFDPQMQAAVMARVHLEQDLRNAVRDQQFILHYQPQVNRDGRLTGAEALVRWQHGQRGMVSPDDFIPLAEETGLILPLGHWVLDTACRQLAVWAKEPRLEALTLAVNISAQQFNQPDLVDQVLAVLKETGANPSRLKLELTESMLVADVDDVIKKMSALKRAGVSFSLDDFGTGYSSLSYLSRLPLDQIKIDRSFVMQIEWNDGAAVICAATISLAHSLKLTVVAEGVETEAQRYFLNTVHGCELNQGYLYSRPLPVAEFEAFALSPDRTRMSALENQ